MGDDGLRRGVGLLTGERFIESGVYSGEIEIIHRVFVIVIVIGVGLLFGFIIWVIVWY